MNSAISNACFSNSLTVDELPLSIQILLERNHKNNLVYLFQTGDNNNIDIQQTGRNQLAVIKQDGNNNESHIIQYGDNNIIINKQRNGDNHTSITQLGSNNMAVVAQYGEQQLSIIQDANNALIYVTNF